MESNKLIAEFMGIYNVHEDNGRYSCNNCGHEYSAMMGDNEIPMIHSECKPDIVELAKYHTSWDWLMPVAQKCLEIYHIELMNDDLNFEFYDSIGDIENTYKSVVEFIKNYNDERK